MLKIHSIETFGTHDGPGIRLVIFTQGCNFRCLYCHNPDTINQGGGRQISVKEIMKLLAAEQAYFSGGGGLTISGGEPLLQAEELIALFQEARNRGYHTALDTNASLDSAAAKKLFDITDLTIIDLKHINNEWHRRLTGQGNGKVISMIGYRERSGRPYWLRYVLVPGWTDQPEFLKKTADWLAGLKNLERLEILPYHNLGEHKYRELGWRYQLKNIKMPYEKQISQAEKIFKKKKLPVFIRR